MAARKRTKTSRMRGSHTHGWGDKKKRRNFGHAGGKGRAGRLTGAKKPSQWPEGRKKGLGFVSRMPTKNNPINVRDVNLMIEHNKIEKKGSMYEVDLTSLGYTRLLSKGSIKYPVNVTIERATERAVKKIVASKGNVNTNKTE